MAKNENQIEEHVPDSFEEVLEGVQNEADAMLADAPDDDEARKVAYLEWYVCKMAEVADMQVRVKSQYKVLTNQLKNRMSALTHYMGGQARDITESIIAKRGGKKRSVDTLYGRIGLRATSGSVKVTDEEAFLDWLDSQPDTVSGRMDDCLQRKVVRTTSIRGFIEDTGEVPPGVTYIEAHDKFYPAAESRRLEEGKDG